jgi:DNA polymerase
MIKEQEPAKKAAPKAPKGLMDDDDEPINMMGTEFPPGVSGMGVPSWQGRDVAKLPAIWITQSNTLAELKAGVDGCQLCPLGKAGAPRFFGSGPVSAKILLVVGVPEPQAAINGDFLLPAERELLQAIITKGLKLTEDEVYVTPAIKCPRLVEDYLPTQTEKVCRNITFKQIKLAAPQAVVSFGRDAAQILSKESAVLDTMRRKKDRMLESGNGNAPYRMTIGLDSMLELPDLKKDAWKDLKDVLRLLQKPAK